jgi:DNA-binding response OmpR family regulator
MNLTKTSRRPICDHIEAPGKKNRPNRVLPETKLRHGDRPLDSQTILVIEDDGDIAELLRIRLAGLCDEVVVAENGCQGLKQAQSRDWSLVLLDLGLPDISGLDICRRLRQQPRYTPIMMLTARGGTDDRIQGLDAGADDYITKPFCGRELQARIRALFRRVEALGGKGQPCGDWSNEYGGLRIYPEQCRATLNGEPIPLTATELELLSHFIRNPGRVYSRAQLLDSVWGPGHASYEHTVSSHINRLRAKIEADPSNPEYITTVWGLGYRFG